MQTIPSSPPQGGILNNSDLKGNVPNDQVGESLHVLKGWEAVLVAKRYFPSSQSTELPVNGEMSMQQPLSK